MAKKKAEIAAMPAPQQVTYAPTIGNAELVNMLVEQRVQLLERENEQLRKQCDIHVGLKAEVFVAWIAKENRKIQEHFENRVLPVIDGLSLLLKTGVEYGVELRSAFGERNDYHLSHAIETWYTGSQEAKDKVSPRHTVHIFVTRDGERVEDDEDYGTSEEDSEYIIQNTLDNVHLEFDFNPDDPELKEIYDLRTEITSIHNRITSNANEIKDRDRMEKQALAMFTASAIKASPELTATMQALAASINNGQLLLGE